MEKQGIRLLLNRGFITLFCCYSLACTCFAFVNVGLLIHATEDYGMEAVVIGSVIGMVSIIGLMMRPVSAVVVDRFNRKKLLILAFALEALATFGFAFADQYSLLYALQVIRGIAWALISCAGAVLLVDIVGRDNLGIALGVYALGMVVGSSVAAAVVASLGDAIGYTATFVIASGLSASASLLVATLPVSGSSGSSESDAVRRTLSALKGIRFRDVFAIECTPIMGISFTFQLCATALGSTFLIAYGRTDLGIANVGIAATLYNVIMYVSRPMYGRIMDKYGARWCVIPGFVGFILANMIAACSEDMTGLLVAAVVYGLSAGGYSIAPRTMAMRRLEPGREAVASSTSGMGNDIGMALGSVMVPAVAAFSGGLYRGAYLVMAAIAMLGLIYCLFYVTVYKKRNPANPMGW